MDEKREITRRTFLKSMLAVTAAAVLPKVSLADSALFNSKSLTVWSCGGLAETFTEVNAMYEKKEGSILITPGPLPVPLANLYLAAALQRMSLPAAF